MKPWFLTMLLITVTTVAYQWRESCRQWLLGPEPAESSTEIQEEISRLVFRRGFLPDLAEAASQKILLQQTLRNHRLADTAFHADVTEAVAQEMQSWRRQWEKDEERQKRLIWQRLDETEMEKAIREAHLDQVWAEEQTAGEIKVTEAELDLAFAAQRKHLEIPAAIHVAHLFLSPHQPNQKDRVNEIALIHHRLTAGEKWAALVQKYSEDPRTKNQGGDLGWLTASRVPPEFITVVHRMNLGDISTPIQTGLGWHIVRVFEKQPAYPPRLAEVSSELKASLVDQKQIAAIDRLVRRLLHGHPGATL